MSSRRITASLSAAALFVGVALACAQQSAATPASASRRNGLPIAASGDTASPDPAELFKRGQDALERGQLDEAEKSFRGVLALNPQVGGAYANLGVVYMRRKEWAKALEMLHQAERLMPQEPGIRLNIGLVGYRQGEFVKAIPAFESVVRDRPDSLQARRLLGQCYFFAERWADAVNTLEPLWPQSSTQLDYLYVLMIAANRSSRKDLDEKAFSRLVEVGGNSPEFHLFMGKAHLNLEQFDLALADFQAAAAADPKLPFVHFNLGFTYLKKQQYEQARDEFLKDAEVEPDEALDYDELGDVYWLMQQDQAAEKSYRDALQRNPRLINPYVGLAKVYQYEENFSQALVSIDAGLKLDPERTDMHYIRGQVLNHLGRKEEAKKELELAVRIDNEKRAQRQKQSETGAVPAPELMHEPQ